MRTESEEDGVGGGGEQLGRAAGTSSWDEQLGRAAANGGLRLPASRCTRLSPSPLPGASPLSRPIRFALFSGHVHRPDHLGGRCQAPRVVGQQRRPTRRARPDGRQARRRHVWYVFLQAPRARRPRNHSNPSSCVHPSGRTALRCDDRGEHAGRRRADVRGRSGPAGAPPHPDPSLDP